MRTTWTVSLPGDLNRALSAMAKRKGMSRSQVVQEALCRELALERFRDLRERLVPKGGEAGFHTDEDVFKATGRPEVLTFNGKADLVVKNAAAYEETLDAIRGIQRGLDAMKEGTGKLYRQALDKIRVKHRIPRRPKSDFGRNGLRRSD